MLNAANGLSKIRTEKRPAFGNIEVINDLGRSISVAQRGQKTKYRQWRRGSETVGKGNTCKEFCREHREMG